jgi:transposase
MPHWLSTPRCWPRGWGGGSAFRGCAGRCGALACGGKKILHAAEQERADIVAARTAWRAEIMGEVDPDRLVFLDESGLDTRLTRAYARVPGGQRALGRVPGGHWRRLTILGALARTGLVAVMTVAAATSTAVFLAFIESVLIPALHARPEALVVMDNLAPHKAASVPAALRQAGLKHRFLPACSPDLNPIEPCWSKLKGARRAAAPRSLNARNAALPGALNTITPDDPQAWFRHCGYRST